MLAALPQALSDPNHPPPPVEKSSVARAPVKQSWKNIKFKTDITQNIRKTHFGQPRRFWKFQNITNLFLEFNSYSWPG